MILKIAFFHCYQANHWKEMAYQLFTLMAPVGFHDVRLSLIGDKPFPSELASIIPHHQVVQQKASGNELITLQDVWKTSQNLGESAVFYCHTKGVTHPELRELEDDWWKMMAYFLLEKHEACMDFLEHGATCVGVNFREHQQKHFAGNFWWAKSSYLKVLKEPTSAPEMWVCSGLKPSIISVHDSRVNHFFHRYPRERYAHVD